VVLTNDCHYLDRKDSIAIDALNCIRKGIDLGHPEAKRFACNEYYFKSPKEMKSLSGFAPQLVRNSLAIADKIDVTDGYIPVYGSGMPASKVFGLLNSYPSALKVNLKPRIGHLTISLNGHKSDGVLEYLRQQLPDIEFIRFTEYYPWTVRSVFGAVLNAMKVPEEKIREFRELIPAGAMTLREAALISTDFSCLSSEDYVCALAAEMADTLINTFREKMLLKHNYALVPKGTPVPIARNDEGQPGCQYEFNLINALGFISLKFIL
jgi:DNA polymerase III alpha subunit